MKGDGGLGVGVRVGGGVFYWGAGGVLRGWGKGGWVRAPEPFLRALQTPQTAPFWEV